MRFEAGRRAVLHSARTCVLLATVVSLPVAVAQDEGVSPPQRLERAVRVLGRRDARALGVGDYVPAAQGIALDGTPQDWSAAAGDRGTVVVMTSLTCPLSRKFAPAIARAERTWEPRGYGFVHVGVSGLDSLEELADHSRAQGLRGRVLSDPDSRLATAFGAERTTEVFVLDGSRTLRYRGALSDQYGFGYAHDAPRHAFLDGALRALEGGEEPAVVATWAPGCVIEPPTPVGEATSTTGQITYARHIARFVQRNCLECHRGGGVAPFPLETYEDVSRRAAMCAAVIADRSMPPWFAAPGHGGLVAAEGSHSPWSNDRSLLPGEAESFQAWVDGGKVPGDSDELPLPLRFAEAGWELGEPDATFGLPEPFAVPAEGRVRYQYTSVATGLERDRWVAGIEIRPGAPEVVHHVIVWALPAEAFRGGRLVRRDLIDEKRGLFGTWGPGMSPASYAPGDAKLLAAGSVLLFEIHYTPDGRPRSDRTVLGVRFADDGPDWRPGRVIRTVGISNNDIRIPPGTPDHPELALAIVARPARILAFAPHMHLRGKSFRYELVDGAGETRTLLDVPAFDFNWQLRYELSEPLGLERSDLVLARAVFDNSRDNPANPDPGREVRWGPQTEDEMLIGFLEYVLVEEDLSLHPDDPLIVPIEPRVARSLRHRASLQGGALWRASLPERFRGAFDLFDADGDLRLDASELPLLR